MAKPNVVFILADQHRSDFIGTADGGATITPTLDALAETGRAFANAYCTAPLCSPSRAAIASGRYGSASGCFTNLHQLPPGSDSFVHQFRNAGYRTAAIGKTHMEIHAYDSDLTGEAHRAYMDSLGWDDICEVSGAMMIRAGLRCAYSKHLREIGMLEKVVRFYNQWGYFMDTGRKADHSFRHHEWPFDEALHETAWIGRNAVDWLGRRDRSQPFMLYVGFAGPHSPIEPIGRLMDLYRDRPEPAPHHWADAPDWVLDGRRGYRAMISEIDEWVGRIRDTLAAEGQLDHTIFIYSADHGDLAGDHHGFDKTCFFDGSVHVPMIFAGPGVKAGPVSDALTETLDLGRTACDLAGVPPHDLDQGRSLAPLLAGETETHRDTVYAEMGCDRMLFDGRYKLMWGDPLSDTRELGRLHLDKPVNIPASPARLYDLGADPTEANDLIADTDLRASMTAKLLARINENTQAQPCLWRGEYKPLDL